MLYFIAIIAGIAGFLFGFDEGIIAGALDALEEQYRPSAFSLGVMAAAVPLGALFGALFVGNITQIFGRRNVLLFSALLFVLGALLAAWTPFYPVLIAARILLGVAVGMSVVVSPMYISETAPANIRGALVSIFQLAITIGILSSYLVNYQFYLSGNWRYMFASGAVPGILFFLGALMLPESPRWLLLKGCDQQAKNVLARLRADVKQAEGLTVDAELDQIRKNIREENQNRGSWSELMSAKIRPAVWVGVIIFMLQQLSGINVVIYFAPKIFSMTGFDGSTTKILATIGLGLVNVLMTIVALAYIDKIGRRKLLMFGFAGCALTMIGITFTSNFQGGIWPMISCGLLMSYIACFAISLGPIPILLTSEIFPLRLRGQGMCLATMSHWVMNTIIVFTFPSMLSAFGLGGTFWFYAACCLAGMIYTVKYIPETKGVTLEQIEDHLYDGRSFVKLGQS